jgi:hypothetical protein
VQPKRPFQVVPPARCGSGPPAIHIQRDPLGRFAIVNPVDPLSRRISPCSAIARPCQHLDPEPSDLACGCRLARPVQTGIGPVSGRIPKSRSKGGQPVVFRSAPMSPYQNCNGCDLADALYRAQDITGTDAGTDAAGVLGPVVLLSGGI